MSKELDYLDKILNCQPLTVVQRTIIESIKEKIQRLEAIDNAEPSEALDCLLTFKRFFTVRAQSDPKNPFNDKWLANIETIKQALLKTQEQEIGLELNFYLDELQTQELVETGFVIIDDYCITMINNDIMVYKTFEDYNGVKLFRGNNKNE